MHCRSGLPTYEMLNEVASFSKTSSLLLVAACCRAEHFKIITYYMEQRPSLKANRFSATPEKFPALMHSQESAICPHFQQDRSSPCPTSLRSILMLSSHLCLSLPRGLLLSGFPTKIPVCTFALAHTCYMPRSSVFLT